MISVIGIGPGNRDYMLPIAIRKIQEVEVVIGAQRNLEIVSPYSKVVMDLSMGFPAIGAYLFEHKDASIAVIVTGDAGFYSMLDFVKRHVPIDDIEVIPGISSLQYMYSKLGKSYEDSRWISLHGRACDLTQAMMKYQPLGILTDQKRNNQYIAMKLKEMNREEAKVYVGERLSYEDEKISLLTVEESLVYEADKLSVVVIDYEDQ